MAANWTHLVRFISEEDGQVQLGQVDSNKYPDVGFAVLNGERIAVKLVQGSIFDGRVIDTTMHIARVCMLPSPASLVSIRQTDISSFWHPLGLKMFPSSAVWA